MIRRTDEGTAVQDVHAQSLATSTALSEFYVADLITPLDVICVLNREKVRFVLVGAHGLGGWMRKPRATEDVDVIVQARGQKKAVKALVATFPELEVDDQEVVTRLRDRTTRTVRVDVMKTNQPLMKAVLSHTRPAELGGQCYQIPSLEMALTLKFAAMISLVRADKDKFQDAHDFMYMIEANSDIDLEQLAELGQLVYSGGGAEVVEMVRKVRAGERLQL